MPMATVLSQTTTPVGTESVAPPPRTASSTGREAGQERPGGTGYPGQAGQAGHAAAGVMAGPSDHDERQHQHHVGDHSQ